MEKGLYAVQEIPFDVEDALDVDQHVDDAGEM